MGNCPEFEKYGLLYQSDELAENERIIYNKHLKECIFCREELLSTDKIFRQLKSFLALSPSDECQVRIRQTIKSSSRRMQLSSWKYLAWIGVSAAAVMLLTFVKLVPVPNAPVNPRMTIPVPQTAQSTPDSLEWKNGIDKEISRLKYEIACFNWERITENQTKWNDRIKELEESIKGLSEEIEKM